MVKGKRNSITFTVKSNSADFRRCHCHIEKERYYNAAQTECANRPSCMHEIFTESSEGQTP